MTAIPLPNPYAKQKRYCTANPEKKRAHNYITRLIRAGKMKPAKELVCSDCPKDAVSYHHPNGYEGEYLLDVITVCQGCHVKRHLEMNDKEK